MGTFLCKHKKHEETRAHPDSQLTFLTTCVVLMRKINTRWDLNLHFKIRGEHLFLTFKYAIVKTITLENLHFAVIGSLCCLDRGGIKTLPANIGIAIYHDICEVVPALSELWCICSVSKPFTIHTIKKNKKRLPSNSSRVHEVHLWTVNAICHYIFILKYA